MSKSQEKTELRFGSIARIYYGISGEKLPKQLDLLEEWFPGLIVSADPSDPMTRKPAVYADREYRIHAVRYHDRLYSGGSTRVSQICGRLTGTATGNQEKERKTAELVQKHVAECFIRDMELTPALKENVSAHLAEWSEEQLQVMAETMFALLYQLAEDRKNTEEYERKTEPFAMDDETFDGVIYNAAYQLSLSSFAGLCNAYLWLLVGGLLRNETGRVLRLYDSALIAVRRQCSATGDLEDKLNYLFYPETYEYTYSGDDLENRFPGVEWYCDGCGAHLNEQSGFDDHLPSWKCTACGYENRLEASEIYDNDEDWENRIRPVNWEKFQAALEERKRERREES